MSQEDFGMDGLTLMQMGCLMIMRLKLELIRQKKIPLILRA